MPLFRSESEESRANAWLGRILLIRPVSFTVLTLAALALAVALAAFFVFGEYTRKARVIGTLAPAQGVVRVIAPQGGVVEMLQAREGATVARGEPLLVIADPRAARERIAVAEAIGGHIAERGSALLRQRLRVLEAARAEEAALAARRDGLAREISHAERELQVLERRMALARSELGRAAALERRGFVSAAALDREHATALDHEARLESLGRTRLALAREAGAIAHEIANARARADAQLASLDAQRAALAQERTERAIQYRSTIPSPLPGLVTALLVEPGQMVPAGTTLATIIPAEAALEAHLFAPSRAMGFAREGQAVLLRYTAFPHQKFGTQTGRIVAISRNALAPGELGFAPPDGSREPLYRIKVALPAQSIDAYGHAEPLQPGMQVEADIQLDRRALIEWIFEPLLSLAGRA